MTAVRVEVYLITRSKRGGGTVSEYRFRSVSARGKKKPSKRGFRHVGYAIRAALREHPSLAVWVKHGGIMALVTRTKGAGR